MFVLPYKAKNPPEAVPYATFCLIGLNLLIYCFTTQDLLELRPEVLQNIGVSYNNFNIFRLIASLFLHENPLHILGNMLFLWIFGASVEGRLGIVRYLAIYFTAGILGSLLFIFIFGVNMPDMHTIGASGAIMGALGAYLYMFPFSKISTFWAFWLIIVIRFGVANWSAMGLIGYFVAQDLISGFIFHEQDGVAHIAHLAGFASGYLSAFALRPRVDGQNYSNVKAMLSDVNLDRSMLSFRELDVLMRQPTNDIGLILAFCNQGLMEQDNRARPKVLTVIGHYHTLLIESAHPSQIAALLLRFQPSEIPIPAVRLLALGSRLEKVGDFDHACIIYRAVYDINPDSRDSETALYRIGRLLESAYQNSQVALESYSELKRRFPGSIYLAEIDAATKRLTKQIEASHTYLQQDRMETHMVAAQDSVPDEVDLGVEPNPGPYIGSGRQIEF